MEVLPVRAYATGTAGLETTFRDNYISLHPFKIVAKFYA